jgi:uncharacterized membrane protein YqjE
MIDLETNGHGPGVGRLFQRVTSTTIGALHNRLELLLVELQEEKGRLIEAVLVGVGLLFAVLLFLVTLTATVVFLFPEEYRIYALGGFTVLYLAGLITGALMLKAIFKHKPFAESIRQVKKDTEWIESLK